MTYHARMNDDRPKPCQIVIFGASGDLTKRKLIPALYDLYIAGQMPLNFAVLGISRTRHSDAQFRDHLTEFAGTVGKDLDASQWAQFTEHIHYHAADSTKSEDFQGIKDRMASLAKDHELSDNVLFYLSLAPQLYDRTIENLGMHQMVTEGKAWCSLDRKNRSWQRIIVEKPFGHDPESAAHLNRVLGRVFEEESIYRIDHYLGKETVQNILVFRFGNTIFEPIWNRNYIDHIQVTAAETVGVEGRGGYYDSPGGGAMRDMVQSHLVQLMAMVAMEPPVSMHANDIRVEKNKALKAVRPADCKNIDEIAVRGQYSAGEVGGNPIIDYRAEDGVNPNSRTETYAGVKVNLDTWRWHGVPFYLRSGKAMARKTTEVVVVFKPTPHPLFRNLTQGKVTLRPNQFVMNIQPDEGISLRFEGKVPGTSGSGLKINSVEMDFDYVDQFQGRLPDAYRTLLHDAIHGDQTLFKDREEVEQAWQLVQPVLDQWAQQVDEPIPTYAAGSWGPDVADQMMARRDRQWHNL
jgi:glucose-6-phosphate 1-dehydrogenase